MKACIIAVGSELLTPFRVDTNSLAITERLNAIGYDVRLKAVVGDDVEELAQVLAAALGTVDLIVTTGGLGPTEDDITRDALARAFALPLEMHEPIVDRIQARFARARHDDARDQPAAGDGAARRDRAREPKRHRARPVARAGRHRDPRAAGAAARDEADARRDHRGAAGRPIGRRRAVPARPQASPAAASRTSMPRAQPIYARWVEQRRADRHDDSRGARADRAAPHRSRDEPKRADEALQAAVGELQAELGAAIYSVDGRPLEAVVGDLLRAAGWTIAAAESCTGGLLLSRLTDVPGSSDYVDRGVVCYSNRAKIELLQVPADLIAEHGAVSEPVARAMAEGIRVRAGSDVGIGITGIAGPGGGTPEKPVGTVAIAVAARRRSAGAHVQVRRRAGDGEVPVDAGRDEHAAAA